MKIIEKELTNLKKELKREFIEPLSNEDLTNFVIVGSKFIRSTLAILYFKSQGFEINDSINKIIAVGEFIHSASLLHDDVIDCADTRRGKPTINKMFSSEIAILSGDYLLSHCVDKLLELENFEILKIFLNCVKKMTTIEIKQYFLRENIPNEDEYIGICKGKTASLFACILECCAIILNADRIKAKKFGEIFGICFQIKNDLDNESEKNDIKNGVYTAKYVLGIEKTLLLLDNYKREMQSLIDDFSQTVYKEELEGLINLI